MKTIIVPQRFTFVMATMIAVTFPMKETVQPNTASLFNSPAIIFVAFLKQGSATAKMTAVMAVMR